MKNKTRKSHKKFTLKLLSLIVFVAMYLGELIFMGQRDGYRSTLLGVEFCGQTEGTARYFPIPYFFCVGDNNPFLMAFVRECIFVSIVLTIIAAYAIAFVLPLLVFALVLSRTKNTLLTTIAVISTIAAEFYIYLKVSGLL